MEKYVDIWFLSDSADKKKVATAIEANGLKVIPVEENFDRSEIRSNCGNIFIVDISKQKVEDLIFKIKTDKRLESGQKYIFVEKDDLQSASKKIEGMFNVELIERPFQIREFVILIEKSAIVEKYRELVKSLSRKTDGEIETYNSLIHIHKHYPFESEAQKKALEKIIHFERNLLQEQENLNSAIKEFTSFHQKSIFELQNLLEAGELLNELRQKELIHADNTIRAQQNVIEFSAVEIAEREKILEAQQRTHELSREEAIALHKELKDLRAENIKLKEQLSSQKS